MSNSPNRRLKAFIDDLDDTYDQIGTKTGYSRRTWQRVVEEGASIKSEYLIALHDIYGADVNYILTGERTVPTRAHSKSFPTWEQKEIVQTYEQSTPTWAREDSELYNFDPSEFVSVPYYPNVYASGGQGLIAENERSINMVFRSYFFNNTIQANPRDCFMIRIKGDSMNPMYNDGSDLLVDAARTKIKEGPGFIVRIEDVIYCKLLSKLPDGRVRLSSINKSYDSFEGTPGEDDFEIIGEVVWSAALSKYIF